MQTSLCWAFAGIHSCYDVSTSVSLILQIVCLLHGYVTSRYIHQAHNPRQNTCKTSEIARVFDGICECWAAVSLHLVYDLGHVAALCLKVTNKAGLPTKASEFAMFDDPNLQKTDKSQKSQDQSARVVWNWEGTRVSFCHHFSFAGCTWSYVKIIENYQTATHYSIILDLMVGDLNPKYVESSKRYGWFAPDSPFLRSDLGRLPADSSQPFSTPIWSTLGAQRVLKHPNYFNKSQQPRSTLSKPSALPSVAFRYIDYLIYSCNYLSSYILLHLPTSISRA